MSRLVQLWEESFEFSEIDLAFFAESQKRLLQPFPKISPPLGSNRETVSQLEWQTEACKLFVQKHLDTASNVPLSAKYALNMQVFLTNVRATRKKLQERVRAAETLTGLLDELSNRVAGLQASHEQIKSKSIVMQSLWDGLVARQVFQILHSNA